MKYPLGEILELIRTTSNLHPAYEIAARIGMTDAAEYLMALTEWMGFKHVMTPSHYTRNFMLGIGRPDLFTKEPDAKESGLLRVESNETGHTLLSRADSDYGMNADVIVVLGIDQVNTDRYIPGYLRDAKTILDGKRVAAYAYHSSPEMRGGFLDDLFTKRQHASAREATLFAPFLGDNDRKQLYLGHSYASAWKRLVENSNAGNRKNLSALIIGIYPFWGNSAQGDFAGSRELSSGPEMYIMAGSDIMPYMSDYTIKMAKLGAMLDGKKPFMAFHHPHDKNKVFVILAPGILPALVGLKVNFGGHGFVHYLDALGFGPDKRLAHPGLTDLHEAVAQLIDHNPTLEKRPLADIIGAIPLDTERLRLEVADDKRFLAAGLAQLLAETQHWRDRVSLNKHPLVDGLSQLRKK